MAKIITEIGFEEWVRFLFDHPVPVGDAKAWYWDTEASLVELGSECEVAYATKLFKRGGEMLVGWNDAQIDQGLWLLIGESSPAAIYSLADTEVAVAKRVACVHAIERLFEQLFVPRCTPHLSHLDEAGSGALNAVCYMWWDIFPLSAKPRIEERGDIDAACISVMERTLRMPSIACQESALHGLGHWVRYYPDPCERIVADYLKGSGKLRREIVEYAERALTGRVL
jgi:hypothetical protein